MLRDEPVILSARGEESKTNKARDSDDTLDIDASNEDDEHSAGFEKGDTLGRQFEDQYPWIYDLYYKNIGLCNSHVINSSSYLLIYCLFKIKKLTILWLFF